MALRITLGWIIPLIFSWAVCAEELSLNPAHPSKYLVVEGDTLWQIAGRFLNRPEQWPLLWRGNPAIKNPNYIYPGDVLAFSVVNGKPQVSVADTQRGEVIRRYEKWHPSIRETPINEAVKLLPSAAIDQFLTSPKVVTATELEAAPYVISFAGEHIVAGAGDRMYVRQITDTSNVNVTVYRKGQAYTDPESQEILGYEAEFIADASLQKTGDPATLFINKSASEVRLGDRLMSSSSDDVAMNYFPRPPDQAINGSIISVLNGVTQIGQYNVVVLNKGQEEGLAVGHMLDIYQRGKIIADPYAEEKNAAVVLPNELAGKLMVFRIFAHVSYALILEASQPIHLLDKVKTP